MDTPPDPIETAQRAALRRNRRLATALLICAAAIFLATMLRHEPGFWTLLVRAGAEAAVVGALADWFAMTGGEPFDTLVDRLLDALQNTLEDNAPVIYEGVEERTAWWIPKIIDRRIATGIVRGLAELIGEIRERDNPKRRAIRRHVEQLADDLVHSPSHRRKLEEMKAQLLAQPEIRIWLAALWDGLRRIVLADL